MLDISHWLLIQNFTYLFTRDRRDQKFRFDTDTDTFSGFGSIPRLILILKVGLNRDRYWYWYQENVPGLILIPRLYLIRILPKPYKKCTSLWIDTGTDTETQKQPQPIPILILKALISAFSIRYRYSRLSLLFTHQKSRFNWLVFQNLVYRNPSQIARP